MNLLLLLHGNNAEDWLLAIGGLLYLVGLYVYSELKKNKLKREKTRRKTESLAARNKPLPPFPGEDSSASE